MCFVTLILKLYDGILEKLVFTQPSQKLCVNHHRSGFCRTIQDPASQRLTWYKPPLSVLVIKKVRDASVIPPFISLVKWFIGERNMVGALHELPMIMDEQNDLLKSSLKQRSEKT